MLPSIWTHNFHYVGVILLSFSIISGVGLFVGGIFKLKRYGESRTMMSQQLTLAGPVFMILASICLLLLPFLASTALLAFWGNQNPLTYNGGPDGYNAYIPPILMLVRLVGVGAVIRSLYLISRAGGQSSQPGTIGRAFSHFLGGLLAIHILGTISLLMDLFDFI